MSGGTLKARLLRTVVKVAGAFKGEGGTKSGRNTNAVIMRTSAMKLNVLVKECLLFTNTYASMINQSMHGMANHGNNHRRKKDMKIAVKTAIPRASLIINHLSPIPLPHMRNTSWLKNLLCTILHPRLEDWQYVLPPRLKKHEIIECAGKNH